MAHEHRNSTMNLMPKTRRACGQDEYMSMLRLETIFYNVMAQARSTRAFRMPKHYNYKLFLLSQSPWCCSR